MDLREPLRGAGQEPREAPAAPCAAPAPAPPRWRRRAAAGAGALLGLAALALSASGLALGGGSPSTAAAVRAPGGAAERGAQQAGPIAMWQPPLDRGSLPSAAAARVADGPPEGEVLRAGPVAMWQEGGGEGSYPQGCRFWCVEHGHLGSLQCNICGWWLDFWTGQVERVCRRNHIQPAACDEITNALLAKRWKVYWYVCMLFGLIWLVWFTARRWRQQFPTYWKNKWTFDVWACFTNSRDFHEVVCLYDSTTNERARKNGETMRKQVQDLFDATTRSADMGVGFDGSFQKHKSFKVLKVERVESARNWKKYAKNRSTTPTVEHIMDQLTGSMRRKAERAQSIIDGQQAAMRKTDTSPASRFIDSLRLDKSRNEVLLFHGSPGKLARDRNSTPPYAGVQFQESAPVDAICCSGFDQRLGSSTGMLGSAIYLADKVSKADCYAGKYGDEGETTVGETACIFISRVTLGCPYLAEHALNGIRRPPSTHEEFDVQLLFDQTPFFSFAARANTTVKDFWKDKQRDGWSVTSSHYERFNSVISSNYIDGTSPAHYKRYHEYAVYHGTEAYPEFKVTYERMSESIRPGS